jgi:hypothetical protein
MKKVILFLLIMCGISTAQYITTVGDTTDLKLLKGSGIVLLEQFGKGNLNGGGLFRRIDSTYAEGTNAFDYPYAGSQWARINLVDQYLRLSNYDNSVAIWNTNAYTPIGLDSLWTLINAAKSITATAAQLNYLANATGTTGTNSTNIVFSTSPVLTTPTLGSATATGLVPPTNLSGDIGTGTTRYDSVIARYFKADKQILIRDGNATVFNWGGKPSYPVGRTDTVYAYGGMYGNPEYKDHGVGSQYTRFIMGGNTGMDFEVQSPEYLLLTAAGEAVRGRIIAQARDGFRFYMRSDGDANSPKYLDVNRVDTAVATYGAANTSDVTLNTNSGALHINGSEFSAGGKAVLDSVRVAKLKVNINGTAIDSIKVVGDSLIINIGTFHYAMPKKVGNSSMSYYWWLLFGLIPMILKRKSLMAILRNC